MLVFRDRGDLKARAFLLTQNINQLEALELDEFRVFQVSVTELEQRTNLRFPTPSDKPTPSQYQNSSTAGTHSAAPTKSAGNPRIRYQLLTHHRHDSRSSHRAAGSPCTCPRQRCVEARLDYARDVCPAPPIRFSAKGHPAAWRRAVAVTAVALVGQDSTCRVPPDGLVGVLGLQVGAGGVSFYRLIVPGAGATRRDRRDACLVSRVVTLFTVGGAG
jgi:hypothetical protein